MKFVTHSLFLILLATSLSVRANGPVGEHVNELQVHLGEYTEEVTWLISKMTAMVDTYEQKGAKAAQPEMVVDHWEAVKFHAAVETNYIPLYASIWQGLFAVRQGIEQEQPVAEVRAHLATLDRVLYQALGAVKLAAQYQDQGLLQAVVTREATTPTATLVEVKQKLDRVLAKYAEKLSDEAIKIVQDTYLTRFESVEGVLIEQDADLVEDLEVDFNVRLPKAIQDGKSIDEVREVILAMQAKLDQARALLKTAEQKRQQVF
jgi:hypothetical protein